MSGFTPIQTKSAGHNQNASAANVAWNGARNRVPMRQIMTARPADMSR